MHFQAGLKKYKLSSLFLTNSIRHYAIKTYTWPADHTNKWNIVIQGAVLGSLFFVAFMDTGPISHTQIYIIKKFFTTPSNGGWCSRDTQM